MIDELREADPALVHVVGDLSRPGTHALLVGIGHYEHLRDGGGTVLPSNRDLEQLGCPPRSIRALADRLIRSFEHTPEPVGSVALVVSERPAAPYLNPSTGRAYAVPGGSATEVKAAVRAWARRLMTSPGNISVFAFCGHALKSGVVEVLLLRDYGADDLGLFDGAMDFSAFKAMMSRMPNDRQAFFVDGCRVGSLDLPDGPGDTGVSMLSVPASGRLNMPPPAQSVSYATFEGMQAYGPRDGLSYYTEGLMLALDAAAEQDEDGVWWIVTNRVQELVEHVASARAAATGRAQTPEVERASKIRLFRLPGEPRVPVFVRCDPTALIAQASLSCKLGGEPVDGHHGPHHPDVLEWVTTLRIGHYEFSATFPDGGGLDPVQANTWVMPPYIRVRLAVPAVVA